MPRGTDSRRLAEGLPAVDLPAAVCTLVLAAAVAAAVAVAMVRLYDRDWAQIETIAVMRGMTAAELVRSAAIAAVGDRPALGGSQNELTAQIEQIFRYVHIIATAMRNDMLKNGRGEELEKLVRSARALQGELRKRRPD